MFVQKLSPKEQVLRVNNTIDLVRTAAIEVEQGKIARGSKGVYGAVVAPSEYGGMFGVESNPVTLRILRCWSTVIENCTCRDGGTNNGMPYHEKMSSSDVAVCGTRTYHSGASSLPSFAKGLQVTEI